MTRPGRGGPVRSLGGFICSGRHGLDEGAAFALNMLNTDRSLDKQHERLIRLQNAWSRILLGPSSGAAATTGVRAQAVQPRPARIDPGRVNRTSVDGPPQSPGAPVPLPSPRQIR